MDQDINFIKNSHCELQKLNDFQNEIRQKLTYPQTVFTSSSSKMIHTPKTGRDNTTVELLAKQIA